MIELAKTKKARKKNAPLVDDVAVVRRVDLAGDGRDGRRNDPQRRGGCGEGRHCVMALSRAELDGPALLT